MSKKFLTNIVGGTASLTGKITASAFSGDGSLLTNLPTSGTSGSAFENLSASGTASINNLVTYGSASVLKVTDSRSGRLIYTGSVTPSSPLDGDIWIDNSIATSSVGDATVTGNLIVSGKTFLGTNSFTKAGYNTGDLLLDNGVTDTPGLLFYTANNANWGIDSYFDGSNQILRFVRNLNEAGGSQKAYIDTNGNFSANTFRGTAAGQVLNDVILSNSEVTVVSTTIATSTSATNFITYNYTPVSSQSYLIIHIHISKYMPAGTTDDAWYSVIQVDGSEIAYGWQMVNNDGTGTSGRSGVLFPLTGRYTNSSTAAKTIGIAAKRDTADDSITIDNSATAIWLRITEVAR